MLIANEWTFKKNVIVNNNNKNNNENSSLLCGFILLDIWVVRDCHPNLPDWLKPQTSTKNWWGRVIRINQPETRIIRSSRTSSPHKSHHPFFSCWSPTCWKAFREFRDWIFMNFPQVSWGNPYVSGGFWVIFPLVNRQDAVGMESSSVSSRARVWWTKSSLEVTDGGSETRGLDGDFPL